MSGHTPGPWIWADGYKGLFGAGPNNEVICYATYEGMWIPEYVPEAKANAKLIAAAPDLFAVAQEVMDAFASYERFGEICPFEGNSMIYAETLVNLADVARTAIAKATGEKA